MADLTSSASYIQSVYGNLRRVTINIGATAGTTSDTVDSRLRNIVAVRAHSGSTVFTGAVAAADNGTNANNTRNIIVVRSSLSTGDALTIIAEGR